MYSSQLSNLCGGEVTKQPRLKQCDRKTTITEAENLQRLIPNRWKATTYCMAGLRMYVMLLRTPFLVLFPLFFYCCLPRLNTRTDFPRTPAQLLPFLEATSQRSHYKVLNSFPKSREPRCLAHTHMCPFSYCCPCVRASMQVESWELLQTSQSSLHKYANLPNNPGFKTMNDRKSSLHCDLSAQIMGKTNKQNF